MSAAPTIRNPLRSATWRTTPAPIGPQPDVHDPDWAGLPSHCVTPLMFDAIVDYTCPPWLSGQAEVLV